VSLKGVLLLVVAVLTGAACGVVSRGISDEFSVYERTFMIQLMGAVFFTSLAVIEHGGDITALIRPAASLDFMLAALFLAVGASVVGYWLFNYSVANAPMANVISLYNLTTVVSVLAGVATASRSCRQFQWSQSWSASGAFKSSRQRKTAVNKDCCFRISSLGLYCARPYIA